MNWLADLRLCRLLRWQWEGTIEEPALHHPLRTTFLPVVFCVKVKRQLSLSSRWEALPMVAAADASADRTHDTALNCVPLGQAVSRRSGSLCTTGQVTAIRNWSALPAFARGENTRKTGQSPLPPAGKKPDWTGEDSNNKCCKVTATRITRLLPYLQ